MKTWTILFVGIFALLLAACGGAGETAVSAPEPAAANTNTAVAENNDAMADENEAMADDDAMMEEEQMADDAMMAGDEEMEHDDAMMDEEMADEEMADDDAMMEEEEMADEAMADTEDEAMTDDADAAPRPAWQQLPLTDVRSGETFTLADFAGKTVFVEPMATWCSNCRRQLTNVGEARVLLDRDDVVFIAISVETNISDADLAAYTENTGFDWTFAVGTPELLQALADEFGRTVLNPPATPHFIIRADGTTTDLVTGIEPADVILAQIEAVQ